METPTAPAAAAFQVGATYSTGSGDYEWTFTVTRRTAKFVTLVDRFGDEKRVGTYVSTYDNIERCLPLGRYSLAPVLCSDRPVEEEAA